MPSFTSTSLWQMPQASTFTRTWPGPGLGTSRSTNSQSPPALLICAAFIFVLIVAPNLPNTCHSLRVASESIVSARNSRFTEPKSRCLLSLDSPYSKPPLRVFMSDVASRDHEQRRLFQREALVRHSFRHPR